MINTVSDVSTTVVGSTITANNTNASSYQWLECNEEMTEILGETDLEFTASSDGDYAVEISENGCVEISDCVSIMASGLSNNSFAEQVRLYPNPSTDFFTIEFNEHQQEIAFKVWSVSGKILERKEFQNTSSIKFNLDQPKGIYFLEIFNGEGKRTSRLLLKE